MIASCLYNGNKVGFFSESDNKLPMLMVAAHGVTLNIELDSNEEAVRTFTHLLRQAQEAVNAEG